MLERVTSAFGAYPCLQELMRDHVSMQLEDVGAMLRLPIYRPDAKLVIKNGCNFAVTAVLCNIVSGISVTIFQPEKKTKTSDAGMVRWVDSDKPFKELLDRFFPWPTEMDARIKKEAGQTLYNICRTSFAHSLGIHGDSTFRINIIRHSSGRGLTAEEVLKIEESVGRPAWLQTALIGSGKNWKLVADGFYRDVLDLLCNLAASEEQMKAAQRRFETGAINWRSGDPTCREQAKSPENGIMNVFRP